MILTVKEVQMMFDAQDRAEYNKEEREMKSKAIVKDFCKKHKPRNKVLGYIDHQDWMDWMHNRGSRQSRCKECGRWLYKCEV